MRRLPVVLAVLAAACAHASSVHPTVPRRDPALAAARSSLGPLVSSNENVAQRTERLLRIAELERDLGDAQASSEAMRAAYEHALARDAHARAFGDAAAQKSARAELTDVTARCGQLARRLEDPNLAFGCSHGPVPLEEATLRWAIITRSWATGPDERALKPRFANDPEVGVHLALEIAPEDLVALGRPGLEALHKRLMAGREHGRERVLAAADALLDVDPHHLPARMWSHVDADVRAGRLVLTTELAQDLLSFSDWNPNAPAVLRVERASRAAPDAVSLSLWLATTFLEAEMSGDALVLAQRITRRKDLDDAFRQTAELVAAIAQAQIGDITALDAYIDRHRAKRSAYVWSRVVALSAIPALQKRVHAAQLEVLERDLPRYTYVDVEAIAADPALPKQERLRALDAASASLRPLLRGCIDGKRSQDDCEERLSSAHLLDEYEGGWSELLSLEPEEVVPEWLSQGQYVNAEQTNEARAWLERARSTWLVQTRAFALVELVLAAEAGDTAALERAAREHAARLTPTQTIGIALALRDRKQGREVSLSDLLAYDFSAAEVRAEHAADDPLPEWLAQAPASESSIAAFSHGLSLAQQGFVHRALALWQPLLAQLDGAEGAWLAYYTLELARAARDPDAEQRATSRLEALTPTSSLLSMAARDPARRCAARLTTSIANGVLASCVEASGASEERGRIWLELAAAARPHESEAAVHRAKVGLSNAELVRMLREGPSTLLAVSDERLARLVTEPAAADALWNAAREHARKEAPAEIRTLATRLLPVFARSQKPHERSAWLSWAAGDAARAARQARAADTAGEHPYRGLLAAERVRSRIPEELALRMFVDFSAGFAMNESGIAQELAALEPHDVSVDELACPALRGELGLRVCARAFNAGSRERRAIAHYADLLENPESTAGIDRMAFVKAAKRRLGDETPAEVLHLESLQLADLGRTQEAAAAETEAWMRGHSAAPREQDLDQARLRPLTFRLSSRQGSWGASRQSALAYTCLVSGDIDLGSAYVRATFARDLSHLEAEQRSLLYSARDLLELGRRDRAQGVLDEEGFAAVMAASRSDAAYDETVKIEARHPKSDLVRLMLAEQLAPRGELDRAGRMYRDLLTRHPDLAVIALDLVGNLLLVRKFDEARAIVARVKQKAPDDPRFAEVSIPDGSGESIAPLPAALASADALSASLAQVTDEQLAALDAALHAQVEIGAEVALPSDFEAHSEFKLGGQKNGFSVGVLSMPRASRCQIMECLEPALGQFERMGLRTAWKGPTRIDLGDAAWSLNRGPGAVLITVAVAIGERVYAIFVGGPDAVAVDRLPVLRLAMQSFRPLDALVSASTAEALRWQSRAPWEIQQAVDDGTRLAARRVSVHARGECPLRDQLAKIDGEAHRGWLILDTYLATVDDQARRAVARCATTAREKRELGLLALWDESPELHDLGAAIVRAEPEAAVAQLRLLSSSLEQRALASADEQQAELPRHGLVELLAALPREASDKLARELLESESTAKRASVLVAASYDDAGKLPKALLARVREAKGDELWRLLMAGRRDEAVRDAMRARLDAIEVRGPGADVDLARALTFHLARWLDRADAERLERVRALVAPFEGDDPLANRFSVAWSTRVHTVALGAAPATDDRHRDALLAYAAALTAARSPRSVPARAREMSTRSLADSLPGSGWAYFRVARPDLLVAGFEELYQRLGAETNPQRAIALSFVRGMVQRSGGTLLEGEAGLDLTRPIECAAPAYRPESFVCSGYVRDATALRSALQQRRMGQDAGVSLAMHVGRAAGLMPVGAPLLPGLIHSLLYGTSQPKGAQTPIVARERIRMASQIAGHDVLRHMILDVHEDGEASVDEEVYLFQGARWFVFASDDLARWVLGAEPGDRFSRDPAFRKASAGWRDGGALQAFMPNALDAHAGSLELTTNARGIYVRMRGEAPAEVRDVGKLAQALPEGAATKLSIGNAASWLATAAELAPANQAGSMPPLGLLKRARALSFGWYPAPGQPLWSRWLVLAELDDSALAEMLAQVPRGATSTWRGLHVARRDPVVLLSSDAALLTQGLERLERGAAAPKRTLIGAGQVDGARSGAFLAKLGQAGGALDKQAIALRGLAAVVDVARDMRFEVSVRGKEQTLEAQLVPELSAPGTDTKLVAAWGASTRRNALAVPKDVPPAWLDRGVLVRLETAGSQAALLSAFPASTRLTASASDANAVEVRVVPAGSAAASAPPKLAVPEIMKRLQREDEIRPDHERVRSLARQITSGIGDTQARVQAVLSWMSKNIRYELNPSSVDALAILDAGRGDCSEFAVLTVSLLRAIGIPSELRSGLLLEGNELVAHAWVAYHDGASFHEIDPTAGRMRVHAGYLEASLLDLMSLLALDQVRVANVSALE